MQPNTLRGPVGWMVVGAVLLLGSAGCDRGRTAPVGFELAFDPASLDLGPRSVGAREAHVVRLDNRGRAGVGVHFELTPGPIAAADLPGSLAPGLTPVTLVFAPTAPGSFEQRLVARSGDEEAILTLRSVARMPPECPQAPDCRTVRYDLETESCVQSVSADGTACGDTNLCLMGGACREGVCLGEAVVCDDQNACTIDVCRPQLGCEFLPGPPCPSSGACDRGVCDPAVGCTVAPVADGTPCVGGRTDCDVVDVCFNGTCQERPSPANTICAEASPCQGPGRCEGNTCVRPPATVLTADWSLDGRGTGGAPRIALHDLWMDADGEVSLEGWPAEQPLLRASSPDPVWGFTSSRRCLGWDGRPVCSDFPFTAAVSRIHPQTGDPLWTFALDPAAAGLEGYFSTIDGLVFVTRLATLSSDRLLALYEGFHPDAVNNLDGRRRYAVVVLDAQGQLVRVTRIEDPLLDRVDHPHPFGVAADALGNVYLCFSPSQEVPGSNGVVAGRPSLFIGLSRNGQERWRAHHDFIGGELAVADGILYPERAEQAFSAVDGRALATMPGGKLVVGDGSAVTFSAPGAPLQLEGRVVPSLAPAWRHPIPGGHVVNSPLLALARWTPRAGVDRTVVISQLVRTGPVAVPDVLLGVEAQSGKQAFLCPIQAPAGGPLGPAQRLHSAGGFVAMMEGATPTGDDPPFADSAARFTRWRLPTVQTPVAPWSGEFGGYDHDHQEEPPVLP